MIDKALTCNCSNNQGFTVRKRKGERYLHCSNCDLAIPIVLKFLNPRNRQINIWWWNKEKDESVST